MKKSVFLVACVLVTAFCLAFCLPACQGDTSAEEDGTYYLCQVVGVDKSQYINLKGDRWTDNNTASGFFTLEDTNVVFYTEVDGNKHKVLFSGKLRNYVIELGQNVYVSEKHNHVTDNSSWTVNGNYHWKVCSECNQIFELNAHTDNNYCTVCGKTPYDFRLGDDGTYYTVAGFAEDLTVATIPSKYNGLPVKGIDKKAFADCSGLTGVTIPDSVTEIGEYAFAYCNKLTYVKIPDGITNISNFAFAGCGELTSVKIPASVKSIGLGSFADCEKLINVTIPNGVTSIGDNAFFQCGFQSITIPGSVKKIDYQAFAHCDELTSVIFSDGVAEIGWGVFLGCKKLTSITLPDSITLIEDCIVTICYNLKDINYAGTIAQWETIEKGEYWGFVGVGSGYFTVHCLDGDIKL